MRKPNCSKCGKIKEHRNNSYCKQCQKTAGRNHYLNNKEHCDERMLQHRKNNREHYRKKSRNYKKSNPDKTRASRLKYQYGITVDEYSGLLQKQNGVCCICLRTETRIIKGQLLPLSVDHDHSTGKIRGLLCFSCNTSVGHFQDNPELLRRAAIYLETA